MNTTDTDADGRRRRRRHSAEFKADAIAACRQAGVSIAAVALRRGLNANLLRRWVAASERDGAAAGAVKPTPCRADAGHKAQATALFVPMSLPAQPLPSAVADIRIELRRGNTAITVTWPSNAAAECASWIRELLR